MPKYSWKKISFLKCKIKVNFMVQVYKMDLDLAHVLKLRSILLQNLSVWQFTVTLIAMFLNYY